MRSNHFGRGRVHTYWPYSSPFYLSTREKRHWTKRMSLNREKCVTCNIFWTVSPVLMCDHSICSLHNSATILYKNHRTQRLFSCRWVSSKYITSHFFLKKNFTRAGRTIPPGLWRSSYVASTTAAVGPTYAKLKKYLWRLSLWTCTLCVFFLSCAVYRLSTRDVCEPCFQKIMVKNNNLLKLKLL